MAEMHKHLNPHKMCIDSTKSTSKVFNAQPTFMLCKRTLLMNREPKATLEMIYFAMPFREKSRNDEAAKNKIGGN